MVHSPSPVLVTESTTDRLGKVSDRDALLYGEISGNDPHRDWVVLVHGAGGSVRTWKYQRDVLARHFNLLLMDLRDHGNSQELPMDPEQSYSLELLAEDIARLMDAHGIRKAHFLGVSLGTIVIRAFEKLYPGRVQSIVFAGGVFKLNWKLKVGLGLAVVLGKILSWKVFARLLSFMVMPFPNHQQSRRIFLREADRIPPKVFRKWLALANTVGRDLNAYFDTPLKVPTLAVMGSQDHVFLGPARRYARKTLLVTLEVLPGCGHVCNIEDHESFNLLATSFLLSHARQSSRKS